MLSAAKDLIEGADGLDAGIVLLADILPTLIIKLTAPFFVHRLSYRARIMTCIVFAFTAFLVTGLVGNAYIRCAEGVCRQCPVPILTAQPCAVSSA